MNWRRLTGNWPWSFTLTKIQMKVKRWDTIYILSHKFWNLLYLNLCITTSSKWFHKRMKSYLIPTRGEFMMKGANRHWRREAAVGVVPSHRQWTFLVALINLHKFKLSHFINFPKHLYRHVLWWRWRKREERKKGKRCSPPAKCHSRGIVQWLCSQTCPQ